MGRGGLRPWRPVCRPRNCSDPPPSNVGASSCLRTSKLTAFFSPFPSAPCVPVTAAGNSAAIFSTFPPSGGGFQVQIVHVCFLPFHADAGASTGCRCRRRPGALRYSRLHPVRRRDTSSLPHNRQRDKLKIARSAGHCRIPSRLYDISHKTGGEERAQWPRKTGHGSWGLDWDTLAFIQSWQELTGWVTRWIPPKLLPGTWGWAAPVEENTSDLC